MIEYNKISSLANILGKSAVYSGYLLFIKDIYKYIKDHKEQ